MGRSKRAHNAGKQRGHHRKRKSYHNPEKLKKMVYKEEVKKPAKNTWENIVLYYLSKLKNYWYRSDHRPRGSPSRINADRFGADVYSATSEPQNEKLIDGKRGKRKIVDIVSKALHYGMVNGVVSRNGNYFSLRKMSEQQPDSARPLSVRKARTLKADEKCKTADDSASSNDKDNGRYREQSPPKKIRRRSYSRSSRDAKYKWK